MSESKRLKITQYKHLYKCATQLYRDAWREKAQACCKEIKLRISRLAWHSDTKMKWIFNKGEDCWELCRQYRKIVDCADFMDPEEKQRIINFAEPSYDRMRLVPYTIKDEAVFRDYLEKRQLSEWEKQCLINARYCWAPFHRNMWRCR
jgi:hypothetical protein